MEYPREGMELLPNAMTNKTWDTEITFGAEHFAEDIN